MHTNTHVVFFDFVFLSLTVTRLTAVFRGRMPSKSGDMLEHTNACLNTEQDVSEHATEHVQQLQCSNLFALGQTR